MIIYENYNISELTTFKIGGKIKYLYKPQTIEDVQKAFFEIQSKSLPYFILGEGSNVLVSSKDFPGAVISMLELNKIWIENNLVHAEAGVINSSLAEFALEHELQNFDFLYRMPGSIGGSTLMNARAFNLSISDIILEALVIDKEAKLKTIKLSDMNFAYKQSIFQSGEYIIVKAIFKADKGIQSEIKKKMLDNESKRLSTKQYDFPSAGCIFKNNYNIGKASGKIIDDLGLKGLKVGDAEVYSEHGNFIINKGKASSEDVKKLIDEIKNTVKEKENIDLECEVRFLGEFD